MPAATRPAIAPREAARTRTETFSADGGRPGDELERAPEMLVRLIALTSIPPEGRKLAAGASRTIRLAKCDKAVSRLGQQRSRAIVAEPLESVPVREQEIRPATIVGRPQRHCFAVRSGRRRIGIERRRSVPSRPQGAARQHDEVRHVEPRSTRQLERVHIVVGQHLGVVVRPPE